MITGQGTPESERKVTITPVARPVRPRKRSTHIDWQGLFGAIENPIASDTKTTAGVTESTSITGMRDTTAIETSHQPLDETEGHDEESEVGPAARLRRDVMSGSRRHDLRPPFRS
ncbi:MAG: hypothetical protein CMJ34_08820 [Phycisphaerae bacterium]|nr:hypothetical protein [Phycisphaerae bacterium]